MPKLRPPKKPTKPVTTNGPTLRPALGTETPASGLAAVGRVFAEKGSIGVNALVSGHKRFGGVHKLLKKDTVKSATILQGLVSDEYTRLQKKAGVGPYRRPGVTRRPSSGGTPTPGRTPQPSSTPKPGRFQSYLQKRKGGSGSLSPTMLRDRAARLRAKIKAKVSRI